ncbi:hypothetical protein [Streptomyces sp. SKN60]|nr:hypothetical protein [Streptomyces sp. SKN60]
MNDSTTVAGIAVDAPTPVISYSPVVVDVPGRLVPLESRSPRPPPATACR